MPDRWRPAAKALPQLATMSRSPSHLPAQAGNLLLQPDRLGLGDIALFAVGPVRQTVEHPFGTLKAWMGATHFLTRTHPPGDLGDGVIFVAVVHCFEECLKPNSGDRCSRGCRLVRFLDRKIAARLPTLYP